MDSFSGSKLIEYSQQLNNVPPNRRSTWDPSKAPTEAERYLWSKNPFELVGGYHSLFVYCDIVRPSFVGDSYTQLLRIVEIPPKTSYGDQIVITYPNIQYIPVMNREFETIEIDIKDDTGLQIPFEFGRSIVVLHFRKKL